MELSRLERVLDVLQRVTSITRADLLNSCLEASEDSSNLVSTLNLQHLRQIAQSEDFYHIYKNSHFIVADGVPIVWLVQVFFGRRISRLAGVEICKEILCHPAKSVVIGSTHETLSRALTEMQSLSQVEIFDEVFQVGSEALLKEPVRSFLVSNLPRFVILALGSPKQEYLFRSLSDIKLSENMTFFGLGGSLDILSGKKTRAPLILQNSGLEWFWRLCQSPRQLFPRYASDGKFLFELMFSKRRMGKVEK
jgi:N-acetylglucosaminyldiphosphoundecaprenol N-acetyl-beta-D-mannosaminyltransferase